MSAHRLGELYAPVRHDLNAVERIFDEELVGELPFVGELCDTVRSYRGKMLRPALLLLTARATGTLVPAHHTLAAVVEMVHMATLVHDDVLDEAGERRRRPTVNNIAGNVAAVLLGDYLISHAFHLCSGLRDQYASRRIGATTNTVCEGELLQNHLCGRDDMGEDAYFRIVRGKTGALTATACELGARYAGAGEEVMASAQRYGMACGVAFQIVDDVLDVMGEPSMVGKTLGLDAALGKLTLPAIHALAHGDPADIDELRDILHRRRTVSRQRVRDLLCASSSVEYAVNVAHEHVHRALAELDLLPESDAKTSLSLLAGFIVDRPF